MSEMDVEMEDDVKWTINSYGNIRKLQTLDFKNMLFEQFMESTAVLQCLVQIGGIL